MTLDRDGSIKKGLKLKRLKYLVPVLIIFFGLFYFSRNNTTGESYEAGFLTSKNSPEISYSPNSESPSSSPTSKLQSPEPTLQPVTQNKEVLLLAPVNKFRGDNGKVLLTSSENICALALERLAELNINYSHDGFEEVFAKSGKSSAAENIAMTSANKGRDYIVSEMWAKSERHRNNMLSGYTEGCGYYDGQYAVFLFFRQ